MRPLLLGILLATVLAIILVPAVLGPNATCCLFFDTLVDVLLISDYVPGFTLVELQFDYEGKILTVPPGTRVFIPDCTSGNINFWVDTDGNGQGDRIGVNWAPLDRWDDFRFPDCASGWG